ncbi:hypothetical protein [Vibrio barjaei]|uniref:hypothetical protein n=1 Tax=Vibrio barjaei TaxID=1676683 RepID=UPI0022842582|nr:hypothetical protein [Vibrio barjaei]MCY9874623.1 hypothetical protein [Vibrio barjaei]
MPETIPSNAIHWDADCSSTRKASDFIWTFEPDFPIENIGGSAFIEMMDGWLDDEISEYLYSLDMPDDTSAQTALEQGETRLAGWMDLDEQIAKGEPIKEPIHLALIPAPTDSTRQSICDGWHRIGAAIKHKKTTIPAYVGRLKTETK